MRFPIDLLLAVPCTLSDCPSSFPRVPFWTFQLEKRMLYTSFDAWHL
jgi:hypothetical protein